MLSRWASGILKAPRAVFQDWHTALWLDSEWEQRNATPSTCTVIKQAATLSPGSFLPPLEISTCALRYLQGSFCKSCHRRVTVSLWNKKTGALSGNISGTGKWGTSQEWSTTVRQRLSQILGSGWWQKRSYPDICYTVRAKLCREFYW